MYYDSKVFVNEVQSAGSSVTWQSFQSSTATCPIEITMLPSLILCVLNIGNQNILPVSNSHQGVFS